MKPDVVVFDLGKVLVDFDYSIAGRRIAARSWKSADEVQDFIDHSPLLFRYETGTINRRQFYEEVCQATGYSGRIDEFGRCFADIFTPIPEMVALHQRLREQRIPTFIFSNTNDLAIEHIRANFPFFSNFDDYVLSYEHGAMKPSARLYEVVEKISGKTGSAILYLDDRPENAEAGLARGWQVIQHESAMATIPKMRRRGFAV